jgi:uncharacterized protein (DUF58 family)
MVILIIFRTANIVFMIALAIMLLFFFYSLGVFYKYSKRKFKLRRKPYRRIGMKQFRNSKCSCGSGKKYKFCCMK